MKKSIHIGFGIPTLMLIFTILCLSIFALFSYVSAYNAYQQSLKYQESTFSYYNARNVAYDIKYMLETNTADETLKKDYNITMENDYVSYSISMNDHSYLEVILDHDFSVLSMKQKSNYDGNYGNTSFVH